MEKLLNVIGNPSSCGTCATTQCGTCGPTPTAAKPDSGLSRRQFSQTVLAASAGALLVGCSSKSEQIVTAAAPSPAAPPLSAELNVVQTSKGPIMTVLEEFYKMGPGPSSSHTMGP